MAHIVAIANQKGGVGKTTTAVNLSAALAQMGRSVLLVDLDPQGNATSGLGIDKNELERTLYDVFAGEVQIASVVVPTELETLFVVPSSADLVGTELELSSKEGREGVLKAALLNISSEYDYVFIDCPPSLGVLTINALVAAHSILVPLQCEYYALEGISALVQTIELAKEQVNKELELEGVVLTMFDPRTNLSRQVAKEARSYFGKDVYSSVIPRNVRISEAPSFGKPVVLYQRSSLGAGAYIALAKEFDKKRKEKIIYSARKRKAAGDN